MFIHINTRGLGTERERELCDNLLAEVNNGWEPVLFHHVGSKAGIHVIRLGSKFPDLVSHPAVLYTGI